MKTGIYSILYTMVLNMAIGACFLPLLFLTWKRMRQIRTYRVIGLYWLLTGCINLIDLDTFQPLLHLSAATKEGFNCCFDMLDTPIALLIFAGAIAGQRRKRILSVLLLFIIAETIFIAWKGYNATNSSIIVGAGLVLSISCCVTGLFHYMRSMEHTPFENSMVYVYSALIFNYGSYLILYIFSLVRDHSDSRDSSMVYYTSLLLSGTFTAIGLWAYGIRRPALRP